MNEKIMKKIEEPTSDLNRFKLVKIKEIVLHGYPLLSLKERDFEIKSPYVFSTLTYSRPLGPSRMGSAEVEIYSPAGDVLTEKVYFEFKYSEAERIEDAQKADSFKIRPETLFTRKTENFTPNDFTSKYSDVQITKVKPLRTTEEGFQVVRLDCEFDSTLIDSDQKSRRQQEFSVEFIIKTTFEELTFSQSETETIQVNVRRMLDESIDAGEKLEIKDLEHFTINPTFLRGSPPVIINSSVILPRPYIDVIKIEYIPPYDIDSKSAQLIVEYDYNGRTHSERVGFEFVSTIRQAAEILVKQETVVNYRYIPLSRRVPPVHMDEDDFTYDGDLPLRIVGVEYKYESVDPDNRFVNATLLVMYRTVVVKVIKRLEFQYSFNEYVNGKWIHARTENSSIFFDKTFISPDSFYEKVDPVSGVFLKPAELVKNATISPDYPYKSIEEIKLINFEVSSRLMMFKVTATEEHGGKTFTRTFEKHVKMKWSYDEFRLGKITEKDLIINQALLPEYPHTNIDEDIFYRSDNYGILSIQYIYPGDDAKEMDVQVQLVQGARSRFLTKHVVFPFSLNELKANNERWEIINTLRMLKPQDLTLLIDIENTPPSEITEKDIVGIPKGVQTKISYKPPRNGERATRVLIEFTKDNFTTGFEQTLIFAKPLE